ncbi:Uncharacterised protein [Mycobacteroides abscessus subsp. abscessus]|nr:Uncharacterised protein [Mycobacteroides abscessus subsp. abscessus]
MLKIDLGDRRVDPFLRSPVDHSTRATGRELTHDLQSYALRGSRY